MKWTLRNRILIPTVVLLTITAISISAVSYWVSRTTMEATLDAQLQSICTSSLVQVENWVEGQQQNIVHWAAKSHLLVALQNTPEEKTPARR